MDTPNNTGRSRHRDWTARFRVFSPRRLRVGYRAIKRRCANDIGFKRACVSVVVADTLLTVICPPLGLFAFWFTLAYVMPRSILEP